MHADDELFIPRRARCGLSLVLLHKISKKRSQCVAPGGKHERVLVAEIAVQRRRRQAGRLGDAADGRRGDAVRDEQRLRRVDHPPDVLFPFLTAFHGLHLPAQSCLQYAMFSRRLQPQMCRVETFVPCTARRSVVCSRQTERFLPAGADVLALTEVGVFFLTGFTGHKKRPDLIRGGPCPLELPSDTLSVSLPHLDDRQQKEPPAEAEGSSFGLFCFGRWKPNQAAFFALACAASALLPSTTRSMARMTSRMAKIARM